MGYKYETENSKAHSYDHVAVQAVWGESMRLPGHKCIDPKLSQWSHDNKMYSYYHVADQALWGESMRPPSHKCIDPKHSQWIRDTINQTTSKFLFGKQKEQKTHNFLRKFKLEISISVKVKMSWKFHNSKSPTLGKGGVSWKRPLINYIPCGKCLENEYIIALQLLVRECTPLTAKQGRRTALFPCRHKSRAFSKVMETSLRKARNRVWCRESDA